MTRRTSLAALLLPALTLAAPPREPMDEAIDRGLQFLRRTQQDNGSWTGVDYAGGLGRPLGRSGDPAVTALAVMAFLAAGHVPGEGQHGEAVENGVRYVLGCQQRNGLIAGTAAGSFEMYHHGICTLMLAEAAGMTRAEIAPELREKLTRAVQTLLAGQRKGVHSDRGGWRYQLIGHDADLSVTGWQLMALRAARNIGCDVPAERVAHAVDYVRRCHDPATGGFRYTTQSPVTVPCTGTGILALELCGKEYHRSPEVLAAGKYILDHPANPHAPHFFYGIYYTAQGMFQLGDPYWKQYRPQLHNLLLSTNGPNREGAWQAGSPMAFDDFRWGPNYCTSMAILALTVEYRLLPIYQRFEEPIEAND